jgi:hypothetical protein
MAGIGKYTIAAAVMMAIVAMLGYYASAESEESITFVMRPQKVKNPRTGEEVMIAVGDIKWGKYVISLSVNGDLPSGSMTDGKVSYPISRSEAAEVIVLINEIHDYMHASEIWFERGGKYANSSRDPIGGNE